MVDDIQDILLSLGQKAKGKTTVTVDETMPLRDQPEQFERDVLERTLTRLARFQTRTSIKNLKAEPTV